MKLTIAFILCLVATISAQGIGQGGSVSVANAPSASFGGVSVSVFFRFVLQREADRLLTQLDFPADLAQRVQDVLDAADTIIVNCDAGPLPWLQIRCAKPILMSSKNQLKAINDEWQLRLEATTVASNNSLE